MDEGNRENQQSQPGRNEPPKEALPASDVDNALALVLSREADRLAMTEAAPTDPQPAPDVHNDDDSDVELSREADRLRLMMTEGQLAEWKSAQCRSRYEVPFTRRKILCVNDLHRHMRFTHWQTEIRKPDELVRVQTLHNMNMARAAKNLPPLNTDGFEELWQAERRASGLPELNYREKAKKWSQYSVRGLLEVKRMFETDVEAEVAGTVLSLLYDDYAKMVRDQSYENHRTKIRFHGCRWLIQYTIEHEGRPDIMNNLEIRDFASLCSNEFKRIADDKKLRGIECPEDLRPAVDEYIHRATRYKKPYPLSELPDPKIFYKHGKKRKDSSWLELECSCYVHKKTKVIKWAVPMDACLCDGLNYRLNYTGDPKRRRRYTRKNQTGPLKSNPPVTENQTGTLKSNPPVTENQT